MDNPSNGKVSLLVTVKNESATIQALLDSVASQTRPPDEMIIVDGGSSDDTVQRIESYIATGAVPFPIRVIKAPGANIPRGRNLGVINSSFDILVNTDVGCMLDERWLDNITRPIREGRAEAVGGLVLGWHENEFQEVSSHILAINIDDLRRGRVLSSARSLAYTKEAWKRVGGFSEITSMAEDTAFVLSLKNASVPDYYAADAIVYWRPRGNTHEVFRQFYGYAFGDGYRGFFPLRYLLRYMAVLALAALVLIFWWSPLSWLLVIFALLGELWFEWIRRVPRMNPRRLWLALKISVFLELGITLGYPMGVLSRLVKSL